MNLADPGTLQLLVVRQRPNGSFRAINGSTVRTTSTKGVNTFGTNVPIRKGDLVGLNLLDEFVSVRILSPNGATALAPRLRNGRRAEAVRAVHLLLHGARVQRAAQARIRDHPNASRSDDRIEPTAPHTPTSPLRGAPRPRCVRGGALGSERGRCGDACRHHVSSNSNSGAFCGGFETCGYVQTALPNATTRAPFDGRIRQWKVNLEDPGKRPAPRRAKAARRRLQGRR